jgi:hypothetical protein
VSFRALNGAPLVHKKTTWAGVLQRRRLLERAGLFIPDRLGKLARPPPTTCLTLRSPPGALSVSPEGKRRASRGNPG